MEAHVPFTAYADVNPSRGLRAGEMYPFVEMAAVPEGGGPIRYAEQRSFHGSGSRFAVGDTLFARITPCTENGKVARVTELDGSDVGFGSTEFIVLAPKPGVADPEFVYQVAASDLVRRRAVARMLGSSGRQRVPTWFFTEELALPAFGIDEQRRIGQVLRAIDDAIESTRAVIEATERARAALAQELLTRGLPGRHSEWKHVPGIGTMPACWRIMRLGDCGRWLSGGTPSKARPEYWSGDIPWVSPKDMKALVIEDVQDHISPSAINAGTTLVDAGTILVVVRGMILAHSLPVALLTRPAAFNQDIKALCCRADIHPAFVAQSLQAHAPRFLALVDDATHGTKRLPTEALFSAPVALPPLEEQRSISSAMENVDARVAREKEALALMAGLKWTLAAELLSGVRHAAATSDDIAAS